MHLKLPYLGEDLFVPTDQNYRTGNRIRNITDELAYRRKHQQKRTELGLTSSDAVLLSLVLNTDGLKVHENPNQSAWPVFATIAELDSRRRFLPDKILNLALWSGEGKPPIECIFDYLQQEVDYINKGV